MRSLDGGKKLIKERQVDTQAVKDQLETGQSINHMKQNSDIMKDDIRKFESEVTKFREAQEEIISRITELERLIIEMKNIPTSKPNPDIIKARMWKSPVNSFKIKAQGLESEQKGLAKNTEQILDIISFGYVTKGTFEILMNSFENFKNSLPDIESFKAFAETTNIINQKMSDLEYLRVIHEANGDLQRPISELAEDIMENKDAIKTILDLINSLKSSTEGIEKELNQRATSIELGALKISMNE